jgi:Leucine-rich repeat (LRR) protein
MNEFIEYRDDEIWEEEESDFYEWLIDNYPDKSTWDKIKYIRCNNQNLNDLDGIENLINLKHIDCSHNNLTNLNGIENLNKLEGLWCDHKRNREIRKIDLFKL